MGMFPGLRLQETKILKHGLTPWAAPARSAPTSLCCAARWWPSRSRSSSFEQLRVDFFLIVDGPMSRKGHPRAELISVQHAWHMKKPASILAL